MRKPSLRTGRKYSNPQLTAVVWYACQRALPERKRTPRLEVKLMDDVWPYEIAVKPWWDGKQNRFYACVKTNRGRMLATVDHLDPKGKPVWVLKSPGQSYVRALPKGWNV